MTETIIVWLADCAEPSDTVLIWSIAILSFTEPHEQSQLSSPALLT